MQRWRPVTLLLALLLMVPAALAQSDGPQESRGAQAILIRNPDPAPGEPPYALADQYGKVRRLVEPTPGIDLKPHVGGRVRIKHDTGRTLLASQLELPSRRPAREPRELREVSPAQFIAPSRGVRTADRRAPSQRDRRFNVVPAQGTDEAADKFGEFMDDLPEPSGESGRSSAASDPIQLDDLPAPSVRDQLEPIPAGDGDYRDDSGDYYEEIPHAEPITSGRVIHDHGHHADCPHCNNGHTSPAPMSQPCGCAKCRAKVAPPVGLCSTCGRSEGWCGPTCNPGSRRGVYGRAEYLLWWFDGMSTPPLATVNTTAQPPILGRDGTSVVFGGELLDGARNGMRFTLGAWLDDRRDLAVEADWMIFETETDAFAANDLLGTNSLGRPFYNVGPINQGTGLLLPPQDDAQIVAGGALGIVARSRLQSAGLRVRTGICCRDIGGCGPCGCNECASGLSLGGRGSGAISRIDFIAGYRFAQLEEELIFQEVGLRQAQSTATVDVYEAFEVDNDFHGLDLGFVYDYQARRWGLELMSRIALGNTSQSVSINGFNTVSVGDVNAITTAGGLLAQPSNIGVYDRNRFSVLPELSARLSYRVTPRLSLSAAYTLLYWANVVRPGDQIDFTVDGRQSGGVAPTSPYAHPRVDIEETSLWAHGFNFGLDYQY